MLHLRAALLDQPLWAIQIIQVFLEDVSKIRRVAAPSGVGMEGDFTMPGAAFLQLLQLPSFGVMTVIL